jgi:diguanylate cyclase (GGDEF)-like protein
VKIAGIIQSCMGDDSHHVARYGGEEFLVFLPGSDTVAALEIAQRIRGRVESASLPNPTSRVLPCVTLSIGVATMRKDNHPVSAEDIQRQADRALYRAKESGRNCVVVDDSSVQSAV